MSKVQSAKGKMQSAKVECIVQRQNAESKVQSAKCKVESASYQCKMQSAMNEV